MVDIVGRIMLFFIFLVVVKMFWVVDFKIFWVGDNFLCIDDLMICIIWFNYFGGVCGYCFDYYGKFICIIIDYEYGDLEIDVVLFDFVVGVDVMIYDVMFIDSEYEMFKGWGYFIW